MPGRDWGLLAPIIGCLILAGVGLAERPQHDYRVQRHSRAYTPQAPIAITPPISDAVQTTEKDAGCPDGKENRKSDLCAQWKAVDAAEQSAKYALWSLIGTAIGTGLLIWTLWETRQTARRQLRAYINYKAEVVEWASNALIIKHGMKNTGQTPARSLRWAMTFNVLPLDAGEECFVAVDMPELGSDNIVGAGQGELSPHNFKMPIDAISAVEDGRMALFIWGTAHYSDVFGYQRSTNFRYFLARHRGMRHFHATRRGNDVT